MTGHDDTGHTRLADKVGKIITSGHLSREDQQDLNKMAVSGEHDLDDAKALQKLTSMIGEGRVEVN